MSQQSKPRPKRVEEYWDWFAMALFLLVTLDLLTTAGAIAEYGLDAEINPVIVWLVRQGPLAVLLAHLVVVVLTTVAFAGVVRMLRRANPPYDIYLEYTVECWLGLLLLAGLVVFANNLSVIVLGRSLLS